MLKIFESLEEAIITTKTCMTELKTQVEFQNCKFKQILGKMCGIDTSGYLRGEDQEQLMAL